MDKALTTDEFIKFVKKSLKEYGFKLKLIDDVLRIDASEVSGYFEEESKSIKVSTKYEKYLGVLVHEFNHFQQYIENDPLYFNGVEHIDKVWNWLSDDFKFSGEGHKKEAFRAVIAMELDCERRSVAMIKEYQLDVPLDEYIIDAYIYLSYYNFMKKYKTWYKEDVQLKDMREHKCFSKANLRSDFKNLSKEMIDVFRAYSK